MLNINNTRRKKLKSLIAKFIKKYPFTFCCIVLLAITSVVMIELVVSNIFLKYSNICIEITQIITYMVSGSFLLTNLTILYSKKIPKKILENQALLNLIYFVIVLAFYFINKGLLFLYLGDAMTPSTNASSIIALITCYVLIEIKQKEVSEYMVSVFTNLLILFLVICIVFTGIGVLCFVYNALFNDMSLDITMKLIVFIFIVISVTGSFICIDNVEAKITKFSKVMIKYVMLTMVLIGIVFFYIYLTKILINRELPSNQVFLVCTILFFAGIPTALMSRAFDGKKAYDRVIEKLPLAFLPGVVLQIVSLVLRIHQYGMTMTRYTGLFIIVFEIIYIYIYMYKYKNLKIILLIASAMVIIITYVPIVNMYQFPQVYNSILNIQDSNK